MMQILLLESTQFYNPTNHVQRVNIKYLNIIYLRKTAQ